MPVSATLPPSAPLAPASKPAQGQASLSAAVSALADARRDRAAKPDGEAVTTLKSVTAMRKQARDATRTRVKQTVQRLRDELKLIKKIWAGDPKQLARQISRIAKELKAALADYAAAAKDNGASAPGPDLALTAGVPAAAPGQARTEDAKAHAERPDAPANDDAVKPPVDADLSQALAAYGQAAAPDGAAVQAQKDAEMEARGDLDFARELRDFVRKLRDALQESKIRHAFNTQGRKGQDVAEDEADDRLHTVDKAITWMEVDVRTAFPALDMTR